MHLHVAFFLYLFFILLHFVCMWSLFNSNHKLPNKIGSCCDAIAVFMSEHSRLQKVTGNMLSAEIISVNY